MSLKKPGTFEVDISNLDPKFKEQLKTKDGRLAISTAKFLADEGYGCAVRCTDDGVFTIMYAEQQGEGAMQPAVHISEGKLRFPAGTNLDLMFKILGSNQGEEKGK